MDPAFRGCKENDDRLDQRVASFEIAASQLPQDEEFLNVIKDFPHAEKRRQAHLEARNAAQQPFPDTPFSRRDSESGNCQFFHLGLDTFSGSQRNPQSHAGVVVGYAFG